MRDAFYFVNIFDFFEFILHMRPYFLFSTLEVSLYSYRCHIKYQYFDDIQMLKILFLEYNDSASVKSMKGLRIKTSDLDHFRNEKNWITHHTDGETRVGDFWGKVKRKTEKNMRAQRKHNEISVILFFI